MTSTEKKIALIVPGGFGTGNNNLGVPVLEQIVKLLSKEFDVTVFQLYQVNENYKPQGFDLIGFDSRNKLKQYFNFFVSFFKQHRNKDFAVVHGFWVWPCGILAVVLGKILRLKKVVSVLGGDGSSVPEINYGYLHRPIHKKIILWALRQADEVNVLTKYLNDNLNRAGLKRTLKVIPWGIDTKLFAFNEKTLHDPIRFLHIGNFHPVKDQVTLLRAFALIAQSVNCTLTLIGEGNEEHTILAQVKKLGVENLVKIFHHMSYHQLPQFYHDSDFLLHASLSEGQSEVVTEAMSCGLPVCGTAVGLIHDLSNCSISVPTKDYQALADKTLALIADPNRIVQLRNRAHDWARSHDINWTVRQICNLYS